MPKNIIADAFQAGQIENLSYVAVTLIALWAPFVQAQSENSKAAQDTRPGVIIMVEGVGGIHLLNVAGNIAFKQAELPHEVRQFLWSHGAGQVFKDLQDERHFRLKVEEFVQELQALHRDKPDMRIFLVGHRAGTGLIIAAAEKMPPNSLQRIVLLSSALSPNYDLRAALAASKGGIVSYYSSFDYLILHWGTNQFGTIDRLYGPSAGFKGFQVPQRLAPEDQKLYGRLVQIAWTPAMIWQGNWGNHNGTVFPTFLAAEVARWLK